MHFSHWDLGRGWGGCSICVTLIFITSHVSPLNGGCLKDGLCQVSLFTSQYESKRKKTTIQSWNIVFALFEDYSFLGYDAM
jgi:hypothetical protein